MYTIAATAKRGDMRLIAIVLGEKEGKVRNNETMELLNYGFDNYKVDILKRKGEVIENVRLDMANKDNVSIVLDSDLTILSKKSDKSINYDFDVLINDIKLPLDENSKVGKINVIYNNKIVKSSPLIVKDKIYKVDYFNYLLSKFIMLF